MRQPLNDRKMQFTKTPLSVLQKVLRSQGGQKLKVFQRSEKTIKKLAHPQKRQR